MPARASPGPDLGRHDDIGPREFAAESERLEPSDATEHLSGRPDGGCARPGDEPRAGLLMAPSKVWIGREDAKKLQGQQARAVLGARGERLVALCRAPVGFHDFVGRNHTRYLDSSSRAGSNRYDTFLPLGGHAEYSTWRPLRPDHQHGYPLGSLLA